MQVVNLDMTNTSHQCPPGTTLRTDLPKRLCGIGIGTNDLGVHLWDSKIIGYQDETPDAFGHARTQSMTIDGAYVDGISLTHGSNPRQHIWTFAAALDEVGSRPSLN